MKTPEYRTMVASFGLSLALAVAGCSDHTKTQVSSKPNAPIQFGVAAMKDVPLQIRGTGHVAPFASVAIKSQVDGELERVLFNEGDDVRPVQPILVIGSRFTEASVRQAEANLHRDQALVTSAEAEAHQNEVLFNEGAGPAELAARSRAAVEAAQATVAADKVALENAQLQLQLCQIVSPIRGRIGKLLVDVGNTVRKDRTVLAVVNQTRPSYVDFLVPEEQLPAVHNEMRKGELTVTAMVPGLDKLSVGKLLFVDNAADPETSMVALRARFANDDEALWPGETVDATLTLATLANVVVAPSSAVKSGLTGPYVLVVGPDLRVERRAVTTGSRCGGETVIASGVQPGEKLITSGQERATPGKRIRLPDETSHHLASTP